MKLPLSQKYMLTISEAAAYFGIGPNKMRILEMLAKFRNEGIIE